MSAAHAIATIESPPPWREGHTLVLEPGSLFRQLLTTTLRRESGSHIFAVGNAKEALDVIRTEKPSLVVMDWSPFDENSHELEIARALRNHDNPFVRQVPLLVVSNRSRKRDIIRARNAGATDYMLKPAPPLAILDRADHAERNPQPFIEATRFRGPDRRKRPRDVAGEKFMRGKDVRAGLIDPLAAARNAAFGLAEEVSGRVRPDQTGRRVAEALSSNRAILHRSRERGCRDPPRSTGSARTRQVLGRSRHGRRDGPRTGRGKPDADGLTFGRPLCTIEMPLSDFDWLAPCAGRV